MDLEDSDSSCVLLSGPQFHIHTQVEAIFHLEIGLGSTNFTPGSVEAAPVFTSEKRGLLKVF